MWRAHNSAFDRTVTYSAIGDFNIGFPGQYFGKESGLFYNWNRYYHPETGRYRQSDSIGLRRGMNTFACAGSNPVSMIDPMGLDYFYAVGALQNAVACETARPRGCN